MSKPTLQDPLYASETTEQRSPFKPPNDEEVFVTRETEKAKKKEAKEQLRSQKIWEKNTATSRAPLRRVRDSDIAPADSQPAQDETGKRAQTAYSNAQRTKINEALHIVRQRVQFPRQNRELSMQEFIDQKKEMFHAELAYTNVQSEIKNLKDNEVERQKALEKSKEDLNDDQEALLKFIAQDNKDKQDKERFEKETNSRKAEKDKELKELDMKIQ